MSATTPAARSLRPLVPFFVPGSLVRNDALIVDTASAPVEEPPTTVAVRKWDRATGVFVDPQFVEVVQTTPTTVPSTTQAPSTHRTQTPSSGHSQATTPVPTVTLLTPAAILAAASARRTPKPDMLVPNALCARTPPQKPDVSGGASVITALTHPRPAIQNPRRSKPNTTSTRRHRSLQHKPVSDLSASNSTQPARQVSIPDTPAQEQGQVPGKNHSKRAIIPNGTTPITIGPGDMSPQRRHPATSVASSDCVTPEPRGGKSRRANSLSPVSSRPIPAASQSSPSLKYAGMSFEAASPSPVSIPIPRLAGRRHSCLVPGQDVKLLRTGPGDGGWREDRQSSVRGREQTAW